MKKEQNPIIDTINALFDLGDTLLAGFVTALIAVAPFVLFALLVALFVKALS